MVLFRVEHVAHPVTQQVEGETYGKDRDSGDRRKPPVIEDVFAPLRYHRAPFRAGGLRAKAQKTETRRREDDPRHVQRDPDDQRRYAERPDMTRDDAERP